MKSKYLSPINYINFIKIKTINLYFNLRYKPTIRVAKVGKYNVRFSLTSSIEYLLRYKESYRSEKLTVDWIQEFILPGDIVWDVGANIGAYSLLMALKFKAANKGRVYSFEPEASSFNGLNRNATENQLDDYMIPICLALSDKLGVENFYLSSSAAGAATHGLREAVSDGMKFNPVHIQGVLGLSGDYLLEISPELLPNHLKIDVDGFEGKVIEGMSKLLKNIHLKSILIEISDDVSQGAIEEIIISAGFSVFAKEPANIGNKKINNYLFVR